MSQQEYDEYKAWAHGFKDQEERKARVLHSGAAITEKKKATKAIATAEQKKTTVKRAPRAKTVWKGEPHAEFEMDKRLKERRQKEELEEKRREKREKVIIRKIKFTGRKTLGERRRILTERINSTQIWIDNMNTDIRSIIRQKRSAKMGDIPQLKAKIAEYERVKKDLKKQRAELRTH